MEAEVSLNKVITSRIARRESKLIITPKLEAWLEDEGAGLGVTEQEDLDLASKLLMASKENNKRSGRFGASSRGMCHRRQIYAFLGLPGGQNINAQLQNIFNDGTFRHIRWQLMLMKAGILTDVEVPFKVPEWRVSVSLDGENDTVPWMFELKGWGGMKNVNTLKNPEDIPHDHLLQMHTCMFAVGWDMGIYIAESKSFNTWAEVVVPRDEGIMTDVITELEQLNTAVEDERIPRIKDECKAKKGAYQSCPYAARCLKHHSQGSQWPEDEEWPGGSGTSVQVGRQR